MQTGTWTILLTQSTFWLHESLGGSDSIPQHYTMLAGFSGYNPGTCNGVQIGDDVSFGKMSDQIKVRGFFCHSRKENVECSFSFPCTSLLRLGLHIYQSEVYQYFEWSVNDSILKKVCSVFWMF